jgi:hypothetical protein
MVVVNGAKTIYKTQGKNILWPVFLSWHVVKKYNP